MLWLLVLIVALLAFTFVVLRGENLSYLDQPPLPVEPATPGPEMRAVLDKLSDVAAMPMGWGKQRVRVIRDLMDQWGEGDYESTFTPVHAGQIRGEWVLAPGHDSGLRLLYIHGGAFFTGSPRSHRPITDRLARLTGAAVFTLDYRLWPEHRRMDGIEDCRAGYRWILENGPDGPSEPHKVVVAGDSAGGNLTLALISWIRDEGLRQADAAVAFSPATDSALDAPSVRANISTDPMLGPAFGVMAKVPAAVLLWVTWFTSRMMPSDARISPLRGSLSDLPPVLIQASSTEMLFDDARRYVAKAQAAESPVVLQSWPNMVHVWQMFTEVPEAEEAYQNVAEFLEGALA